MSNSALKYHSTKQFWKGTNKERGGLQIGEVLDQFTKEQGVACDGAINGIKLDADPNNPPLRITIEDIASVTTLVARDCSNTIVYSAQSGIDPQGTVAYRASINASNGAAGNVYVRTNGFSAPIVFAYSAEGVYTFTLAGAFPEGQCTAYVQNVDATGGIDFRIIRTSDNVFTLSTFAADGTTPADFIGRAQIQIIRDPA